MSQPPSIQAPVCYRHPNRETWVSCTRCSRPICPECMHEASVGHQCPECVAEGRRSQRPARTAFGGSALGRRGYVTYTLVALNVIAFLISFATAPTSKTLIGSGQGGLFANPTPADYWGAVVGSPTRYSDGFHILATVQGVSHGEYYRLITAMFLHYGLIHLLSNMWALWVVGRQVEAALGPLRFTALYFIAGIGGNVCVYLFADPSALSAGASGAIFGLFGALFVLLRKLKLSVAGILPLILINLYITFAAGGISWQAHIGGLVVGTGLTAALAYAPPKTRNAIQLGAIGLTVIVLCVLTIYRTNTIPPI